MRRPTSIPVLLAALLTASCGSSPKTHYFELAATPSADQQKVSITSPVTVATVKLPPMLDRREMVRRIDENSVDVRNEDLWAAPLADMTRRVLSQDLAARLPADKVVLPDAPAPPRTKSIVVSIVEFGPDGTGKVALNGGWTLLAGDGDHVELHRTFALTTDAPANPADEAAAMSRLLRQLASEMSGTLAAKA